MWCNNNTSRWIFGVYSVKIRPRNFREGYLLRHCILCKMGLYDSPTSYSKMGVYGSTKSYSKMGVLGGTKYYLKIGVYGALNLIVRWVYIVALNLTPILWNIYMGKKRLKLAYVING